jgi:cell division cycle protein 37
MPKVVDYKKWDHIDISDDEDDTHPNVDTPSLFRWRHDARLQKMAELKKEKDEFSEIVTDHQRKMNEMQQKLAQCNLSEMEKERFKIELSELKKQEEEFRRKEADLEKKERLTPLNVDTIGHEGFSKSRINKIEPSKTDEEMENEEIRAEELKKFIDGNKDLLKKFGMMRKWDDSKQFLLDHPDLCCEETANHLVLQCLDYEMEEKHELMEHVAHQTIIVQYLLELAKQLKASPKAPQLISSFFSKLKVADKMYHDAFEDELKSFKDRIKARAQVKLGEAMAEYEEEERQKRLGPGGLDPVEVY